MSTLFEVAILLNPTEKEEEDGAIAEMIIKPTAIVAKNQEAAGAKVLRSNLEKFNEEQLDRVQVLSRPFV